METFDWPVQARPSGTFTPRVRTVEFADGYAQDVGDGLFPWREEWSITVDLPPDMTTSVVEFLTSRKGYEKFNWTPPGSATVKQFVCQAFTRSPGVANQDIISATFTQRF